MNRVRLQWWICTFVLADAVALAQPRATLSFPHLADYDSEPRGADKRVDIDTLVQRLRDLGATTYYWLVWHAPTDWEDLKLFLPKAAQAHLEVWVYLVPPTEGPPGGYPASEPFKLDYPRWAAEIATLSLQHTNLTAWVIDDFYANHQLFTPDYLRRLQARAKHINPHLAFLPLMYFSEINARFVADYQAVIDGVVVAYPQDRDEINDARAILNGEPLTLPGQFQCPGSTPTRAGDFVRASQPACVLDASRARLHFQEQDDFRGPTVGYHFKQVLVDDTVVWEEDVAQPVPPSPVGGWHTHDLDVTSQARGKTNVTVAFRLLDKQGVSNFAARWRLKDLRADGLELNATFAEPPKWKADQRGPFEAGFGTATRPGGPRVHVPFIVMTAGSAGEFKQRHGEPASPERMTEWLRMCLEARRAGQCDGVVTYCLDKQPGSGIFPLARELFRARADQTP